MLNRREMLTISGGLFLAHTPLAKALAGGNRTVYGGWANLPGATKNFVESNEKPYFTQQDSSIKGTGQDKQVLLWKVVEAVAQQYFRPRFQRIGDCVGQAAGLCADTLGTVQVALTRRGEEWRGFCSTEAPYAGGRIEIGKGDGCFDGWRRPTDGCMGVWAAAWLRKYGVLLRGKYGNIDLTNYRPDLAKQWGRYGVGVPDELEIISRPHPIQTVTIVRSWEEFCDSIANGYPVMVCSGVGFQQDRSGTCNTDSDGFLTPGGTWWHAMTGWGIDTKSKRQGACIANSWGTNWIAGPKHKLGTPDGCFWVDAKTIDRMCESEDCVALSNFIGYRRQVDYLVS